MSDECAVCMEPCAELSVTCCNGHMVCEKHFLQRAKAVYEEGRYAFGGEGRVQRCFLCRAGIPDDKFSDQHHKTMDCIVVDGVLKINEKETGTVWSTQERNNAFRRSLQRFQERQHRKETINTGN